ncbi:Intraflagellar transport protein 20-like protein B [Frankliniella fusca]|uniref:Intraflagellar transport protein 20-like protein B n=1 Tax=Frankliniella fusca TaxID=407009 RepID=A0AAE1H7Q0_9NEOP|nr:Intraflagellar transport protein 20-like protein B [Frankliniella fusca]
MAEIFSKTGLFLDELNKICVLEPEVSSQTEELLTECKDFVERISDFQKIADNFLVMADSLSGEVEAAKLKAIGTRNLLKSMTKKREAQQQQLQALILEKSTELERLRIQHQSLIRTEQEQQEFIQLLVLNH